MASEGFTYKSNRSIAEAWYGWAADGDLVSNESGWSLRRTYFFLMTARNRLLQERMDSKKALSRFNYQTISCLELEEVDRNECPCAPPSGCVWLKTKCAIPQTIGTFKNVVSIDGGITYTYVDWEKFKYKINSRIKAQASKPYYTTRNIGGGTYIYILNDDFKKFISVTGIFENPLDVQRLPDCDGIQDTCTSSFDYPFILDADLIHIMYELAMKSLTRFKNINTDAFSNNEDDTIRHQTPIK